MSIVTAAEKFIENLDDNLRLHTSEKADLKPDFFERFTEELKLRWDCVGKPYGLWYSFGGSWLDWCIGESSGWVRPYIYEVLVDESKAIRITNIEEFEAFEDEYYGIPDHMRHMEDKLPPLPDVFKQMGRRSLFGGISWGRVREKYGAVEITPYLWKKRLNSHWYYGWDCASGCVWETAYKGIKMYAVYDEKQDVFVRV